MSDFGTDKNTQFAEDKAKINLMNLQVQRSSSLVNSWIHQNIRLKVLLKNMPLRPAMPFPMSLKPSETIPSPASLPRVQSVLFSACCWAGNNPGPFGALFFLN